MRVVEGFLGTGERAKERLKGTGNKQKSVEGTRGQLVFFQGTGYTVKDRESRKLKFLHKKAKSTVNF